MLGNCKGILVVLLILFIVFSFQLPANAEIGCVEENPLRTVHNNEKVEVKTVDFYMHYKDTISIKEDLVSDQIYDTPWYVLNGDDLVHVDIPTDILGLLRTKYSYNDEGYFILKGIDEDMQVYINAFLNSLDEELYVGEYYMNKGSYKLFDADDYWMHKIGLKDDIQEYVSNKIIFKSIEVNEILLN